MLIEGFKTLHPITQALCGTLFAWFLTALGAGLVFFFKTINRQALGGMLGFASGIMIAASYWSLLAPAIEMAEEAGGPAWVPAAVGFLAGGFFIWLVDRLLPHLHAGLPREDAEGISTSWRRSILLVLAITIHNIPEGLAVGVAFGALATDIPSASLAGAMALAPSASGSRTSPKARRFPSRCGARGCPAARASGTASFRAWWSRWPVSRELRRWC
jgi:ZIP family zinc transporter